MLYTADWGVKYPGLSLPEQDRDPESIGLILAQEGWLFGWRLGASELALRLIVREAAVDLLAFTAFIAPATERAALEGEVSATAARPAR